jgi:hypothetical protein
MDLYDVEVGRIRGNTYKVVAEGKGMYAEELKRFIEKATGMYLTLGRGFAKGGNIEKSIKERLSKSFELPLQMAVYVPSTKDKNVGVTKKEMDERVLEVKSFLAELFGGFNSVKVEGGFESSDKGLIEEDAVRVVAFASQEGFEPKFEKLVSKIKSWCKEWSQESIGLEFENDLFYIESDSKYAKGGMITVKSDDGEDLMYKIDTDEKSIEVNAVTKQYLTDIVLVMNRDFRKLGEDKFIFWYDDMSDSDITELEEVFQISLNKYADGGQVSNPYEEFLLQNGFRKSFEVKKEKFTEYRKGRWYCFIDKKRKEIEVGKYDLDYSDADVKKYGAIREDDAPLYHSDRYTNSFTKFKKFLDNYYILDEQYTKMAQGGNVWDEDLNVYTLVSSKEYFGTDTASDKRRWFRRNGRGLTRDQAKRMAQDYIDRYGKERVYIGNIRHYR